MRDHARAEFPDRRLLNQDHLHLTVIKGYVGKLLGNARVVRHLAQNHPEFLGEFQTITEITPAETADAE